MKPCFPSNSCNNFNYTSHTSSDHLLLLLQELLPLKVRLTFFQKGGGAFTLIFSRIEECLGQSLDDQTCPLIRFETRLDRELGQPDGQWPFGHDHLGHLAYCLHQFATLHDLRYETDSLCLTSFNNRPGQDQLNRLPLPHDSGQALGTSGSR